MLSPWLRQIKEKIEAIPVSSRTGDEEELLRELEILERYLRGKNVLLDSSEALESFSTKITSGPGGNCPCCGR